MIENKIFENTEHENLRTVPGSAVPTLVVLGSKILAHYHSGM